MSGEKEKRSKRVFVFRWLIFMLGLMIMAFGIVLMIKADLGSAPWDVLHIGLAMQLGLTIGSWSIIMGILIIIFTCILMKSWPQVGAVMNMLFVGVFIDIFMFLLAWLEPSSLVVQFMMLVSGILIVGLGIGLYIAPNCGAGPRDSLMLAITHLTGWKVQYVRGMMEIVVLFFGWLLGGPVFIGTVLFCVGIGTVVGFTLPLCSKFVNQMINTMNQETKVKDPDSLVSMKTN